MTISGPPSPLPGAILPGSSKDRESHYLAIEDDLAMIGITQAAASVALRSLRPAALLARHGAGDWGAGPPEDARENALSLRAGFRILSSYPVGDDPAARVWIFTEAARSATLLLLPSEY